MTKSADNAVLEARIEMRKHYTKFLTTLDNFDSAVHGQNSKEIAENNHARYCALALIEPRRELGKALSNYKKIFNSLGALGLLSFVEEDHTEIQREMDAIWEKKEEHEIIGYSWPTIEVQGHPCTIISGRAARVREAQCVLTGVTFKEMKKGWKLVD